MQNVRHSYQLIILAITAFALSACQDSSTKLADSTWVQLPIYKPESGYQLQHVKINTLQDINNLKGSSANFYVRTNISFDRDRKNGELTGHAPRVRTVKNQSGVHIPTDANSLQLLTLYYHIEKLRELDNMFQVWGDVQAPPRRVAVFFPIQDTFGKLEVNAKYSGELDAFLFTPFPDPSLPLIANGGVIAHEHFHAIFQSKVITALHEQYPMAKESPSEWDEYHSFIMRGLNEGLADVWGWAYSGDDDFVRRSIPEESYLRKMSSPLNKLYSHEDIQAWLMINPSASPYSLGSQFAKYIKLLAQSQANSPEHATYLAQLWTLQFLPQLKENFLEFKKNDKYLDPQSLMMQFSNLVLLSEKQNCSQFEKHFSTFNEKQLCSQPKEEQK